MTLLKFMAAVTLALAASIAAGCAAPAPSEDDVNEATGAATSGQAPSDPQLLIRQSSCLHCHAYDRKLVGPSFTAIATEYRRAPRVSTVKKLVGEVRRGSKGAWGAIPMPANEDVPEADAETMVSYLLDLPDAPSAANAASDAGADARPR